jgi:Domain of unknown function (DUF4499)
MARAKRPGVVRPSWLWFLLLDGGILALTKLAVSKTAYDKVGEMTGDALPPRETLQALLIATAVVHAAEALAAGRMAKRRGLAPGGWRLQTLIVGFPSLRSLRQSTRPV